MTTPRAWITGSPNAEMDPDNYLNSCNACDAIGVDPDSLAGYCAKCEAEAHAPQVPELRADGHYWIICETCGIEVRKEHKDAVLTNGDNVHEALGNRGQKNGYHCPRCAWAKLTEMLAEATA